MSEFTFEDLGEGRFSVSGEMTFDTAEKMLRTSENLFDDHTQIEVNLTEITDSDSAGLALLLEWVTWANHSVREIRFTGVPEKIIAIARTTEVEPLLALGERWSGFIDSPDEAL